MRVLLAVILVAGLPPSMHPWPIGKGPRYRPLATTAAVRAGRPVGRFAGIGVGRGCVYALRTTAPTGVVAVAADATLGDLFRIWGPPLGRGRLDPRTLRLTPRAQIVLETRGYVPPHPTYLFPEGTP